ncbi:MAG: hypothetical protein ACK51K_18600 [Gammaproteobacteria bacterium]
MKPRGCKAAATAALVAALSFASTAAWTRGEGPPQPSAGTSPPAETQASPVKQRITRILAGPEFSAEETFRFPAFKEQPGRKAPPAWLRAIGSFFKGLGEMMRVLVWVLGAVALVTVVAAWHRWWLARAPAPSPAAQRPVVSVAGLDIRPGSLPSDIGREARAAWERGERAQALALLYRGAVSALVARAGAPIRDSSTEEDCLRAARIAVAAPTADYFARLTRVRLLAVYGGRWPETPPVLGLCDEYATHFGAAAPLSAAVPPT